jgi:hypothetical protein
LTAKLARATPTPAGVTEVQLHWIATRLGVATDLDACAITGVDITEVRAWHADPGFSSFLDSCNADRREAFKLLTGQLLPQVFSTLSSILLESKSEKNQLAAAQLILRSHALLIDRRETISRDAVTDLFDQLRQRTALKIVEVPAPKALPFIDAESAEESSANSS